MNRRLLPVDWLVAAYNAVLAVIWLVHIDRTPYAKWILAAHVAALALPWLLRRDPRRLSPPIGVLGELYPIIWLFAFWPELDLLRPVLALEGVDGPIAALDLAVFGVHIHEIWLPKMSQLWVSESMMFLYLAYYPLIFLPPLIVGLQGRIPAVRDITLRLMLTYLVCYVVFIAFPVDGPHFLMEPYQGPHTEGFFYRLVQVTQFAGDSRGASFPSSHVAGAVAIAYVAWQWFPRWVATVMTIEAIGVLLSTTYSQNHFAVDSVAGLVLALGMQMAVVPVLYRILGPAAPRVKAAIPGLSSLPQATDGTGSEG